MARKKPSPKPRAKPKPKPKAADNTAPDEPTVSDELALATLESTYTKEEESDADAAAVAQEGNVEPERQLTSVELRKLHY